MYKVLFFDVGGVLIDFTEDMYLEDLSKRVNISTSRLRRVLFPLMTTMEYGRMDLDHAKKIFADHFNMHVSKLQWVESYKRLAKPEKRVIALVKRLSKRYKICLITNVAKSRYRENCAIVIDKLMRARAVRCAVVSSYVGLRKPGPKIYRYALKKMHVKAKDSLFVDNLQENVDGARRVGMAAVRFRNYSQLVRDLKKLKVM